MNLERKACVVLLVIGLSLMTAPGTARDIAVGDTFFAYEETENLDFSALNETVFTGTGESLRYLTRYEKDNPEYGQMNQFGLVERDGVLTISTDLTSYDYDSVDFGTYFAETASYTTNSRVYLREPKLLLDVVLASDRSSSVAGKTVTPDTGILFKVGSGRVGTNYRDGDEYARVRIELKASNGAVFSKIGDVDLTNQDLTDSTIFLGDDVHLADLDDDTYMARAVWDSPRGFSDYADYSNGVQFTISSIDLSIEADRENVIRNNAFTVTVQEDLKKSYYLYIKDAGIPADQYPYIKPGQSGVVLTDGASFTGASDTAADALANSERAKDAGGTTVDGTAAIITTTTSGLRTIGIDTTASTEDRSFTIKVVDPDGATKTDEVTVTVQRGEVTVTAEGAGSYYHGEEIKLCGTNTDSEEIYLFMTGPNIGDGNGVSLDDLTAYASRGNYVHCQVESDDTWGYRWDTSKFFDADSPFVLDSGTYTLYAVSASENADGYVHRSNLDDVRYQTIGVYLKNPTLSLDDIESRFAKGGYLTISGTATGAPDHVALWLFGKNFRIFGAEVPVRADGTFEYTLYREDTRMLSSGQHYIVVQHPMADHLFNVFPVMPDNATDGRIANDWSSDIVDLGTLPASDAATALTDMIESPHCYDIYQKASFMVEEPWIAIDPIENRSVGDRFTITGTTNIAVNDYLNFDVSSTSFEPSEKTSYYDPFSHASGWVWIDEGTDRNRWSCEIDTKTFQPDTYSFIIESVDNDVSRSATFTLEGDSYLPPEPSGGNYRVFLYSSPFPDRINAGESVLVEGVLDLKDAGDYTFPDDESLEFYSELEDLTWSYNLKVNGRNLFIDPKKSSSRYLRLSGWDLAYKAGSNNVRIEISLNGNAPATSSPHDQTLFRVRQMDGNETLVEGSEYILRFTPSGGTPPVTTAIPLSTGWNFVSIPRNLATGSDTAAIFAAVDTADHSVLRYDTASGTWSALKADDPLRPLEGYWIYSTTATTIPLTYSTASVQPPSERALTAGWNAVGLSETRPAAARDALLSLKDTWTTLIGFDRMNQQYETSIIRGGSGIHSDSREMLPAKGYWLYMTENGTLCAIGA
ncbi:hypothetical protein E2N92_03365 [Methanofollis formosanus]|uniref:DUF3821 domain-containing protein n=1 Tax=Methanofollis formosanus TaxID=299308 RepID=A0A8G1A0Y7_9EURY|nr:MEMAR_RS02690 family S-layer glycoprotein [Methanofollis formosanus]QYZ78535.1 hypothetical protein E2N92_03365 [Methanofollis formosanus]